MKRYLLIAALFCLRISAQPTYATIAGPVYLPGQGTGYSGGITVLALGTSNQGNYAILRGITKCTVSAGGISGSCRLVPGSYSATYDNGTSEYWTIPGTGTYTVAAIRTTAAPAVSLIVSPSQISTAGATVGQCLVFNGSAYAPGSCGMSSATSSWASLTSTSWASLTSTSWASLAQ